MPQVGVEQAALRIDALESQQKATETKVQLENTLVVAHGGVLRALLDLMGKPEYLTQNVFANARPIRFERDDPRGPWRLYAYSKSNRGFVDLDRPEL